jgi:hypothetical protein
MPKWTTRRIPFQTLVVLQECRANCAPGLREQFILILLRSISEHDSRDLVRVEHVEHTNVVSTKGMTDENIRRHLASISEKRMQFCRNPQAGTRHWSRITSSIACTVVRADS